MPKAAEGDIRLFLMNGEPLMVDGKYAAVHRMSAGDDVRKQLTRRVAPQRKPRSHRRS